jgi:hypothetical protein
MASRLLEAVEWEAHMDVSQRAINAEPTDLIEMSKQGYFTLMLDENLRVLEAALDDDGFKVVVPPQGLSDSEFKRMAKGWAILTRNARDFMDDAVRYDYDVIAIEDIKFIDDKPDRTNDTVRKVSGAVRRSQIGRLRGNFLLKVRDNGTFHLQQLV